MTTLKISLYTDFKHILEGMGRDRLYTVYDWKDEKTGTRTRIQLLHADNTAVVFRLYTGATALPYSFMFWHVPFPDKQDSRNPQAYNLIYDTVWPRIRKAICPHEDVTVTDDTSFLEGVCACCDARVVAFDVKTIGEHKIGAAWRLDVRYETWTNGHIPSEVRR